MVEDDCGDSHFPNISVETLSNLLWSSLSRSSTAAVSWPWASEFWGYLVGKGDKWGLRLVGGYVPVGIGETPPLVEERACPEKEIWNRRPL